MVLGWQDSKYPATRDDRHTHAHNCTRTIVDGLSAVDRLADNRNPGSLTAGRDIRSGHSDRSPGGPATGRYRDRPLQAATGTSYGPVTTHRPLADPVTMETGNPTWPRLGANPGAPRVGPTGLTAVIWETGPTTGFRLVYVADHRRAHPVDRRCEVTMATMVFPRVILFYTQAPAVHQE